MVIHDGPTPLYRQVKEEIVGRIERGELQPHDRVPSERELCQLYGLSRTTVRQAIGEAEKEGLVYRIQGKGTFVAKPKITQGLFRITSFERSMRARGVVPRIKILKWRRLPVDIPLGKLLDLDVEAEVLELTMLGLGNEEPMVLYESSLVWSLGEIVKDRALAAAAEGRCFSMYQLYAPEVGRRFVVEQTFEAGLADGRLAEVLATEVGSPVFSVTSLIRAENGRPVELRRAFYRGDKYRFNVTREFTLEE